LHFFNIKKAFKLVNLGIETYQAKQIVRRFDSNFDEELSLSDITDIFRTASTPLNQELERRTVFAPMEEGQPLTLNKQCLDYVRDIFEHLLQAAGVSDKIRVAMIKRPQFSLKRALRMLRQRGSSELAIGKLQEICETHQLISVEYTEPLSVDIEQLIGLNS